MTFGQIFLGIVTISVATVIFRWQKAVDRQSQMALWRYDSYKTCLETINACQNGVVNRVDIDQIFELDEALDKNLNSLFLIAPFEVVDALRLVRKVMMEIKRTIIEEKDIWADYRALILASTVLKREMRKDIFSNTQVPIFWRKKNNIERWSSEKYAEFFGSKENEN